MKYAVLILGLLAASYANAQDHLKDFSLKRSLKQDGLHLQFMVLDTDRKGIRHYNPSKFYYWTKAQHVRATQGASSGLLLHGLFEAFYPDKQLAKKGKYTKGLKHGEWNYWNADGTFRRIENWRHGNLSGKQEFFDDNGSLVRTEYIRGEKKKLVQKDSIIHWKSFERKTIILLDSVGNKVEVQRFKNDKLHGVQKQFVAGKLDSKTRYKKGELVATSEVDETQDEEQPNDEEEKEPGKITQLWNKLFNKDEQTKEEKKQRESKRKSREENAEGEK